jgi:hypothetical protein
VYIPPKQSTYSSEEAFNELEDEIIAVSKNTKHIALVDDLNSKTSTVEDCNPLNKITLSFNKINILLNFFSINYSKTPGFLTYFFSIFQKVSRL